MQNKEIDIFETPELIVNTNPFELQKFIIFLGMGEEIKTKQLEENKFAIVTNNSIPLLKEKYKEWSIEKGKEQNLCKIKQEISETIIEFKGGRFKMRKKDIGEIGAYFEYADKTNGLPVSVFDSNYKIIPMTHSDFIEFGKLVGVKKLEITNKYK